MAGVAGEAVRTLEALHHLAEQPPCVVVLGEANSGKTTLANALAVPSLLPSDVIPNTRYPTLMRYSATTRVHAITAAGARQAIASDSDMPRGGVALLEIGLPLPQLLQLQVLDTPSGFAPDAIDGLPSIGSVLIPVWCTVATQAWKSSEQVSWSSIDDRHRAHGVLVVTGIDRIAEETQRLKLAARLEAEAGDFFKRIAYSPCAPDEAGSAGKVLADIAQHLAARRRRAVARLSDRLVQLAKPERRQHASPASAELALQG